MKASAQPIDEEGLGHAAHAVVNRDRAVRVATVLVGDPEAAQEFTSVGLGILHVNADEGHPVAVRPRLPF